MQLWASAGLVATLRSVWLVIALQGVQGSGSQWETEGNGSKTLKMLGSDSREVGLGHRGGLGSDMCSHVCGQSEND